MGRGLLDEETQALITVNIPNLRPFWRVLHWSPDSLSMNFPPDSTIPSATVCFHDTQHTLAEARQALFECYAHAIYYRIAVVPRNELAAVFWERYYNNDLAHRLYGAAEHLAAAIEAMLEIRPEVLDLAVQRLGRSADWRRAMSYRGSLVHEQPPLMEGTGIVYARGSRWQQGPTGNYRLAVGGGDAPSLNTETVADFLHRAMVFLLDTFRECVEVYITILAEHRINVNDTGVTLNWQGWARP